MRLFDLAHDAMLGAAEGRLESFRWRVLMNSFYAIGASVILGSILFPLVWAVTIIAAMALDLKFARDYLAAETLEQRNRTRTVFVIGAVFTLIIFVVMPTTLALIAAGPGRSLAILMACSSLVALMAYLYTAPGFLLISLAPTTLCILAIPFMPPPDHTVPWLNGAIGMTFGVVGFLIYLTRSATRTERMLSRLNAATQAAETRRAEAEAGSRAKTEFLAQMTHELRTPLNAVIGYAEIIREELEDTGKASPDDATHIHRAAKTLVGIIDRAISLSNLEKDVLKFDERIIHSVLAEEAMRRDAEKVAAPL